jgi:PKHD-type hydroxylase
MILPLHVLSPAQLESFCQRIEAGPWHDGALTAGQQARAVKNNRQLDGQSAVTQGITRDVLSILHTNAVLELAARPRAWSGALVNSYSQGGYYGWHTDDSQMQGLRTDLSYTLFLSAPQSYDGGELTLRDAAGEQAFKLPAGSLLLYPATCIHSVTPVTRGTRLAVVGWIESRIRDAELRSCLFDLGRARRHVAEAGDTDTALTLAQVEGALLRRFG